MTDRADRAAQKYLDGNLIVKPVAPLAAMLREIVETQLAEAQADLANQVRRLGEQAKERMELKAEVKAAFVGGAAWWEFESTGGTIWQSDRRKAEDEADRRWPGVPWPALAATKKEP